MLNGVGYSLKFVGLEVHEETIAVAIADLVLYARGGADKHQERRLSPDSRSVPF